METLGRLMGIEALLMAPLAFGRNARMATPTPDVIAAFAARRTADKRPHAI